MGINFKYLMWQIGKHLNKQFPFPLRAQPYYQSPFLIQLRYVISFGQGMWALSALTHKKIS